MTNHETQYSGHFECNGFAAKLEGKHLNIKIAGDGVEVSYSSSLFTADEIAKAITAVSDMNDLVLRGSRAIL